MATGTPFFVGETTSTVRRTTIVAPLQAVLAVLGVTGRTWTHASTTERVAALAAGDLAFITEHRLALEAAAVILPRNERFAVAARLGEPVFERHKRAFAVVGLEKAADEQKEVEEPPLGERPAKRFPALAFTQLLFAHMRMRHLLAKAGRVGI